MIFDFNNDNNSINTTVVYNFTTKKSNFNKSLVNKRNFNINNFSYKRDTTLQDHINYTKKYTINTSHQNRKITYQNNFINNHKHKWINRKIL